MNIDTTQEKNYSVDLRGDYIHLRFNGTIEASALQQSTDDILQVADEQAIHKLLDDIRDINSTSVTIRLQTVAIGLLWRLKHFDKVALLYKNGEIGRLIRTTLETIPFSSKCRAFDDEADAVAWLQEK